MRFKNSSDLRVSIWIAFVATAGATAFAVFQTGRYCVLEFIPLRVMSHSTHAAPNRTAPNGSLATSFDPIGLMIPARTFDDLARFSAVLAHEQRVDLIQLQSERLDTAPPRLSQVRVRLRIRGDYVGTKAFLASLLTNFPGLTVEHLTMRRNLSVSPDGDPTPATRGGNDDDSAIELIQYSEPVHGGA